MVQVIIAAYIKEQQKPPEYQLIDHLFDKYHKKMRPTKDRNTTINVTFSFVIIQLIEVNDRYQYVKLQVWVRQNWRNEYLYWNESEWNNISYIMVEPKTVWIPDLILHNNGGEEFPGGLHKFKTDIRIDSDGNCSWNSPATFTSTCKIDIRYFPFDRQSCKLIFSSWTYDATDINLTASDSPVISTVFRNSSQWDVVRASSRSYLKQYPKFENPYSEILVEINLLRKPLYYVFNVITPCLVLVINIFIGFYLPPDCGERVSLTITILLAVAVFLQLVSDSLPRNSDSIPILAIFYMVIMTESACSLLTTCVVLIMHHRGNELNPIKMPNWVRKVFLDTIGNYLNIRKNKFGRRRLSSSSMPRNSCRRARDSVENIPLLGLGKDECRGMCHGKTSNQEEEKEVNDLHIKTIVNEIQNIRKVLQHNRPTQTAEILQEDWKLLAKILDRFFFRLLLLTVLFTTCGILVPIYLLNVMHDTIS